MTYSLNLFRHDFEDRLLSFVEKEVAENLDLDDFTAEKLLEARKGDEEKTQDLIEFAQTILVEAQKMGLVHVVIECHADFDEDNQPNSYPVFRSVYQECDGFYFHEPIDTIFTGTPWKVGFCEGSPNDYEEEND